MKSIVNFYVKKIKIIQKYIGLPLYLQKSWDLTITAKKKKKLELEKL